MINMAAVMIIVVAVMIIIAPLITAVVVMSLVAIRMGSPFNFLGIGVAVSYLYQFIDGRGPLEIQLSVDESSSLVLVIR